jgi:ABC-type nitrate/sulfonate/bicarbonate transport system permease component
MTTPKIASLFGLAGALGVIASVLMGTSERADYLLDASFVCFVLAGVLVLMHVLINVWNDFTRSSDPRRPRP